MESVAVRAVPRRVFFDTTTTPPNFLRHLLAAMDDTIMLEGSQPVFIELNFVIIPNGLSEKRQQEVLRRVFCITLCILI